MMRRLFSCLLSLFALHASPICAQTNLLLAEVYRENIDPTNYLISEKLDGVRAVWDGETLRFRSGNLVNAPAWFIRALPRTPLDGELWAGRGRFERLSGIVRKTNPIDEEWREVRYMIFELPDAAGNFQERAERIHAIVSESKLPWLQAIEQFRVKSRDELKRHFQKALKQGAEGLMLHHADAPYLTGRNPALLKLKPWEDAEARVIAHIPGKGRLSGKLGALRVETPEGKRFNIGTGFSTTERAHPPAIDEIVTYRYQALTASGLPRFPAYVRVRKSF